MYTLATPDSLSLSLSPYTHTQRFLTFRSNKNSNYIHINVVSFFLLGIQVRESKLSGLQLWWDLQEYWETSWRPEVTCCHSDSNISRWEIIIIKILGKWLNNFIWPISKSLRGTTTPSHSGTESNMKERVIKIPVFMIEYFIRKNNIIVSFVKEENNFHEKNYFRTTCICTIHRVHKETHRHTQTQTYIHTNTNTLS